METKLMVEYRRYTQAEINKLIGGSRSKFNRELAPHRKALGPRIGHTWSIEQVKKIFNIFDRPYVIITV